MRPLRRLGMVAEAYDGGRAGTYVNAAEALSVAGCAGALLGGRNRLISVLSGAALLAGWEGTR